MARSEAQVTTLADAMRGGDEFVARARALIPAFRDRGRRGDEDRRIPQESIDDLLAADLLQMLAPKRFGGREASFVTFFDAAHAIAEGDGSTAWLFGILGCHHWVLAHFNLRAQETLYAGRNYALFPLSFSGKGGSARRVEGGYRVTGEWGFCTGVDFSDWVGGIAQIEGEAPGVAVNLLIPKSEVEIVDTWFTAGMRGTGSREFRVRDHFVPEHLTLLQQDIMSGRTPGAAALPGYAGLKAPLHTVLLLGTGATGLGLARRAIDEFVAFTKVRSGYGGINHAARASTQIKIADALGSYDAVHLLVRRDVEEIDRLAAAGRTPNPEQRLRYRRNAALAVRDCVRIVDAMVGAAGARSQQASSPFQLIQRDIHTIATHVILDCDDAFELYGKQVLGLELGPVRQ